MIFWTLAAIGWLAGAYVNGGFAYKSAETEFSGVQDTEALILLAVCSLLGPPVWIVMAALGEYNHGICWNWITKPTIEPVPTAEPAFTPLTMPPNPFSTAPKESEELPKTSSTEPIVGYRVWGLDREKGLLKSTYMNQYVWPRRKKICKDGIDNNGIHAVKGVKRLCQDTSSTPSIWDPAAVGQRSLWNAYQADVAGSVYLWGEVTECALGYLAEFAYPKELWMPEETDPMLVMMLEENYGVPITLRKEFLKHTEADKDPYYSGFPGCWTILLYRKNCTGCGIAYTIPAYSPVVVSNLCPPCEQRQTTQINAVSALAILNPHCCKCGGSYPNAFTGLCINCEQNRTQQSQQTLYGSSSAIVPYTQPNSAKP